MNWSIPIRDIEQAGAAAVAPVVEVTGLTKRHGATLALDAVSLSIMPNQIVALLGPNGAGKTTLLHILCTILRPDAGTAMIAGHDVLKRPLRARKNLGVVFQEPSLDDRLTVYENLDFHGLVYQVPWRERKKRIAELLALVELSDWQDKLVRTLSSGMKRRLEIARALIHDSKIVFLDEPTVGLDVQSRARIWDYLGQLRRTRDITIVVTTHYIEEVESCDQVLIIDQGKILAEGSPTALKAAHGRPLLRVTGRDGATNAAILLRYPDAVTMPGGEIVLNAAGEGFVDDFLGAFGSRVRQFSLETPSLESVFLSLTGRDLRDRTASTRERSFAAGRRSGTS